jgi:cytoskeletal protein CcmA (bactofilin family)
MSLWGKNKKKRIPTKVDSLIGHRTLILGDIQFTGRLHIDGTVKGNVESEDDESSMLTVSDRGTIEGEVKVPFVILNGIVNGDVYAVQHVELAAHAKVQGNVYYTLIEMAMGAEVNGQLVHASERDRAPLALSHDAYHHDDDLDADRDYDVDPVQERPR